MSSSENAWNGVERRRRRKWTRALEILSAISGVLAIAALLASFALWQSELGSFSAERVSAREDSCYLLRGLVVAAAGPSHAAAATAYINGTELRDCRAYGRKTSP